jgi:tryptophan synthase beta chain
MQKTESILICLSGRGDKDIFTIAEALEDPSWNDFLRYKVEKLGDLE